MIINILRNHLHLLRFILHVSVSTLHIISVLIKGFVQ